MSEALITRDGLMRLTDELEHLTSGGREEIAERLRHAVSTDANILENSDYHDALKDLAALERRIALLQQRIHSAHVVEPDRSSDALEVGERVRVRAVATGETAEYELVGVLEADPLMGRISIVSPLGQALLGKRAGDIAVVEAPRGHLDYEILSTSAPVDSTAAQSTSDRKRPVEASGSTRRAGPARRRPSLALRTPPPVGEEPLSQRSG
jgi:transcription elongation factor GreA